MSARDDVAKYLDERAKVRGLDPEQILGLHSGDEREAALTVSGLRLLVAQHDVLLAACEALVERFGPPGGWESGDGREDLQSAVDAIAKAKGQDPIVANIKALTKALKGGR